MYYQGKSFMAGSSLSFSNTSRTILSKELENRSIIDDQSNLILPVLLVGCFMSFAFLFAPERPEQLASICQRHNPVLACQVW